MNVRPRRATASGACGLTNDSVRESRPAAAEWVHRFCLNEWRATSANPRSFYKCDQCGYEYRVQRTKLAALLQSELAVQMASVVLLCATLLLGALVPFHPERRL